MRPSCRTEPRQLLCGCCCRGNGKPSSAGSRRSTRWARLDRREGPQSHPGRADLFLWRKRSQTRHTWRPFSDAFSWFPNSAMYRYATVQCQSGPHRRHYHPSALTLQILPLLCIVRSIAYSDSHQTNAAKWRAFEHSVSLMQYLNWHTCTQIHSQTHPHANR